MSAFRFLFSCQLVLLCSLRNAEWRVSLSASSVTHILISIALPSAFLFLFFFLVGKGYNVGWGVDKQVVLLI